MSLEISTNFVQQFRNNMAMLAQQKQSRFRKTVMVEAVSGKTAWYDQIGASEAQQITTRQGDTPLANTPHRRRRIDLAPYNWADLIDNVDKARLIVEPTSAYAQTGNGAMNRKFDDVIISAFFATSNTGEDGATTVAFPAANQVAVNSWAYGAGTGNAGMTISKLIEARAILLGGEAVDDQDEQEMADCYIAMSNVQFSQLLATTEATSTNFAEIRALVEGKISRFMGFNFVRSQRLPLDGSGYRRCPVWQRQGMFLGIAEDLTQAKVSERDDKNYATQVYYEAVFGAARVEEARVVEIKCTA